jgi:hypothetical protein
MYACVSHFRNMCYTVPVLDDQRGWSRDNGLEFYMCSVPISAGSSHILEDVSWIFSVSRGTSRNSTKIHAMAAFFHMSFNSPLFSQPTTHLCILSRPTASVLDALQSFPGGKFTVSVILSKSISVHISSSERFPR